MSQSESSGRTATTIRYYLFLTDENGGMPLNERRTRALVDAGMDVARMNLSHGSYDDHERVYRMVREAADASRAAALHEKQSDQDDDGDRNDETGERRRGKRPCRGSAARQAVLPRCCKSGSPAIARR